VTVRQNLGELLNEVQYRGDSVLITRDGKPVAALVNVTLFESIRQMRADFDRLCAELAKAGKAMADEDVEALVTEAVRDARRTAHARRAGRRAKSISR
jgi:prevent-host-death family protein